MPGQPMNRNRSTNQKLPLLPLPLYRWLSLLTMMAVVFGCQPTTQSTTDPANDSTSTQQTSTEQAEPLPRAVQFLIKQQNANDHLWHSAHYGNLKDGAAITAFVLYALSGTNHDANTQLQMAADRLAKQVQESGFVTNADGPDYTNYGSAMLLLAGQDSDIQLTDDVRQKLVDYLVRSQLDDEEGYASSSVDFGGWDLSGWMTGERPTTGTNISVSVSVVRALATYRDQPSVEKTLVQFNRWIDRVHNSQANDGDGGFYFHPKRNHDGNKAGWADGDSRQETRSYGSSTADGLGILKALGTDKDDERVKQSVQWVLQHDDLSLVPGFDHEQGEGSWSSGLRYYYYQSLSQSLDLFPPDEGQNIAKQIVTMLKNEQHKDGSWTNANARMREDDPLIATGFAVIALKNCKNYLGE